MKKISNREKFGNFTKKFSIIRNAFITLGIYVFGMMAFINSIFIINLIAYQKVLSISQLSYFNFMYSIFNIWFSISIISIVLGIIFKLIYNNNRNWVKPKAKETYNIFKNVK